MREKDYNTGKYHVLYILHEAIKNNTNLHSSVNQMWDKVDQEIYFKCGSVRIIEWIMTNLIEQNKFTRLETDKGIRLLNTDNIIYAIIRSWSNNIPTWPSQTLIFHLSNDHKATARVLEWSKKIWELIKYKTTDWNMILINTKNLNAIEEIK